MRKLSLKLRVTLMTTILLLIMCLLLVFLMNISTIKVVDNINMSNIVNPNEPVRPETITPAQVVDEVTKVKNAIAKNSIFLLIGVVISGSVLMYYVVNSSLKPVKDLSVEVQNINTQNLDKQITVPKTNDEIMELAESFNGMTNSLKESFQKQKDFSHNVAHELRTPLTAMRTNLEVFNLTEDHSGAEYREMITNVSNQSNKLIEIVNNLLLFSKDLPISKKSNVNLNLIIEDVVNVVQSEYNSNKVSCKIVGDEIDVLGDEMLLERVFYNLIENAVKYSKNNKNVVITLDSMNKTVK